jgi:dual-specificity kinase
MQAALHQMPQMLPQYPRSLNGVVNGTHAIPPTPSVATRKRKRPYQYTVSYSEVQEVDSEGKLREIIVIDDSPPPPTTSPATTYTNGFSSSYQPPQYSAPIRTRARAAAEAQALSASTSSVAIIPPAAKKRKRDPADDAHDTALKKNATAIQQQHPAATTKSWASGSGAATDEVRALVFFLLI